jgi:hypothetical protein
VNSPLAHFLQGLAAGTLSAAALVTVLALYLGELAVPAGGAELLQALGPWVSQNLGLSVLPFGLTLVLYILALGRLRRLLAQASPLHQVAQADQLTDIWIGVFFGIGVLWTAIGMRSALLFALGGGMEAVASAGASGLLERLVHGGILTALTTTIVGGAGGYLLRVYKAVRVGASLKRFYGDLEQERALRVEGLLQEIRDRLLPATPEGRPCP